MVVPLITWYLFSLKHALSLAKHEINVKHIAILVYLYVSPNTRFTIFESAYEHPFAIRWKMSPIENLPITPATLK